MGRALRTIAACAAALLLGAMSPTANAAALPAAPLPRIDLRVLVVDDGGPATGAITAELDGAGTPYTRLDLADANRPQITAGFLSDTIDGHPRAKFQSVVMPNDNPFPAGSAEMSVLTAYETDFGIRQVDAYTYARPEVGLNYAQAPGYIGSLDGVTSQVTAAGTAGPFGYLDGPVPFEDNSPDVGESYGYLAVPLAATATASFTPLLDAPIPGATQRGSLIGVYQHDGRSELVMTFVYNQYQQQFRLLARGIVEWMTQGIHLGADRNYFAVHVDDVFLGDDRWDSVLNCTPGDVDCAAGTGTSDPDPIRMTPADAQYAKSWSSAHGFTLDLAFNGGGSEDFKEENGGTDPLATQLLADKASFRWLNHTYQHPFLGCVQNVTVVPWVCGTTSTGAVDYVSQADITSQITQNSAWATSHALTIDTGELVTGEHSGLKVLPQQPDDNPNLAPALTATGVKVLASDSSRDPQQRVVGPARTVPRLPMNVFYNAGRASDEVDEYNWIYTSVADGGSGICETSGNSTCLPDPLDISTGYASYIVPLESRIALSHVLDNNPRPHYMHQSNLAEDRIAYPVLEKVLAAYQGLFATNTPVVNLRMKDLSTEMERRAAWDTAVKAGQVTGYRIGSSVTVSAPSGVQAAATVPANTVRVTSTTTTSPFGSAYAGALSGWVAPVTGQSAVTLRLTSSATPAAIALAAAKSTPKTGGPSRKGAGPAPKTVVPALAPKTITPTGVGVRTPYGPSALDRTALPPAGLPVTRNRP